MSKKNSNELLKTVVNALEDIKGQAITVFDTRTKTSAFDHVVIASGTSNRQTRALADSVCKAVKHAGFKVSGIEGTETGEWVLVDCGGVVVHCMQPSIRQYYNLEELWGPDALDLKALFAKKSAQEELTAVRKPAAKKTAAKKSTAAVKKPAAKKPAAKKTTASQKTTVKKTAAAKTTGNKKTAVKTAVKTPAKKTTAKKASVKKVASKKPVAKKTAAKKAVKA